MLKFFDDLIKNDSPTKRRVERKKEVREELFYLSLKRAFVEKQPTEAKKALATALVGF